MTKVKNDYNIEDIIEICQTYLKDDLSIIKEAYLYAKDYLEESELQNLLNISYVLTTVLADTETMASVFIFKLFKLVERKALEEKFSIPIVNLAFGIYKLDKIEVSTENDYLIEYYKKVIVGMSEDVRVIIVTLAIRLNIMRTLDKDNVEENKKIAKETLEIFAPLAHHLGVYKLKSDLEDLSLRYLKPDVYYDIVEKLSSTKKERDNLINDMINEVSNILIDHNIIFEIKGRSKSIYSIYNKLDKGRKFSDIYDLLALRILVDTEQQCYLVLGLIHSKFRPITKRFKDFIAMPKPNGYQSLHTTVFGINNELYEIQIRTKEMNEVAENGLASHWSYKENRNTNNLTSTDQKLGFFKTIIDSREEDKETIANIIRDDNIENNIYVFTPKGDVIELPEGSTPVDFAYRVHSKIGEEMVGALVNNTIVPLNYILQDNDVVKINTSKQSNGPNPEWLKFVKLTQTKNKIKAFFTKNRREELIKYGKESMEKELRKRHIPFNEFFNPDNLKKIYKELHIKDQDTLFLIIESNKVNPKTIYNIIYEEKEEPKELAQYIKKDEHDIVVSGFSGIKVNVASCCKPIPGDEIIGYITRNNGITVHRKDCNNIIHLEERIVDVHFGEKTKNKYLTTIIIEATNKLKLGDVLNKITVRNINIDSVNTFYKETMIVYKVNLFIQNLDTLDKLINDIRKIKHIESVERE